MDVFGWPPLWIGTPDFEDNVSSRFSLLLSLLWICGQGLSGRSFVFCGGNFLDFGLIGAMCYLANTAAVSPFFPDVFIPIDAVRVSVVPLCISLVRHFSRPKAAPARGLIFPFSIFLTRRFDGSGTLSSRGNGLLPTFLLVCLSIGQEGVSGRFVLPLFVIDFISSKVASWHLSFSSGRAWSLDTCMVGERSR